MQHFFIENWCSSNRNNGHSNGSQSLTNNGDVHLYVYVKNYCYYAIIKAILLWVTPYLSNGIVALVTAGTKAATTFTGITSVNGKMFAIQLQDKKRNSQDTEQEIFHLKKLVFY